MMKSTQYMALLTCLLASSCATQPWTEMQTVSNVDLGRFMGEWYVIANIPTFPERDATNPIERYQLNSDGTIETTFTFNHKSPDGPPMELKAKGFVRDTKTNAIWGMQFMWPFKADYRIVYLDPGYETTIIGRNKRDYLWIMSRKKQLSDDELNNLLTIATGLGYDREKIQISSWQQPLLEAI